MRRHYRALGLGLLAALLASCDDGPTAPNPFGPLQFFIRVSKRSLVVGDTATLEVVLHNPTTDTVSANTNCGVIEKLVYRGRSLVLRFPEGCVAVSMPPTKVPPGGEYLERYPFRARAQIEPAELGGLAFTAGSYSAYATSAGFLTNAVRFEVVR